MAVFEVETDLIVHTRVKVRVEAGSKDEAIDAVAEMLPNNSAAGSSNGWSAKLALKAPKGVEITVGRSYHFEQASGGDKARKVGE